MVWCSTSPIPGGTLGSTFRVKGEGVALWRGNALTTSYTSHLQRDAVLQDTIPACQNAASCALACSVGTQRTLLLPSCDATVFKRRSCFLTPGTHRRRR